MRVLLTTASLVAASLVIASPGYAAGPTTVAQLQSDLAGCTGTTASPYVETLSQDLSDVTAQVTVGCAAVLDLHGQQLTLRNIVITAGDALTITDTSASQVGSLVVDSHNASDVLPGIETSGATLVVAGGTVSATGGFEAAGIGAGYLAAGVGSVTLSGGHVHATGSEFGAGIGGGRESTAGGSITVTGGDVTTTSGNNAAGIGGSYASGAVPVTITGGTVTAQGGIYGAGIGGGGQSPVAPVTITGGTVTARGGADAAGLGPGANTVDSSTVSISGGDVTAISGDGSGDYTYDFGHLAVSGGVLRLPSGRVVINDDYTGVPQWTVTGTGRITGSADPSPTYATLTGSGRGQDPGQIQNDGVIDLPAANVTGGGVRVSHRHYDVSFDPGAGTAAADTPAGVTTVYADSFTHGDRAFPSEPTPPAGEQFAGWVALDASGGRHLVTADSDLTPLGDAPGTIETDALAVTAIATYRPVPTVTGVVAVGRTLSAHQSTPGPAGSVVTYRWARTKSGHTTLIPGATASTYRLAQDDFGATVTVVTHVDQPQRLTTAQASSPTSAVAIGALRSPLPPRIKFPPKLHPHVGRSLVAAFAHGVPQGHLVGLVHHFAWYAGTTRVGGDRPSLTITSAMVGQRLHLVVTYTAPGYHPLAVTSNTTQTVRA